MKLRLYTVEFHRYQTNKFSLKRMNSGKTVTDRPQTKPKRFQTFETLSWFNQTKILILVRIVDEHIEVLWINTIVMHSFTNYPRIWPSGLNCILVCLRFLYSAWNSCQVKTTLSKQMKSDYSWFSKQWFTDKMKAFIQNDCVSKSSFRTAKRTVIFLN